REEGKTFEDIGLWRNDAVNVTGIAEPEQVLALSVTDGTLPILGGQPALGRTFSHKDDSPGSPKTVILTHGYWQRTLGGARSVMGRRIRLDGDAYEVIGVMPRSCRFMSQNASVIVPFQLSRSDAFIGNFSYQAVARLKLGVTMAQASADVARMLAM